MVNLQDKKLECNVYQSVAGSFSANSKFKTGTLIFIVLAVSSLMNSSSVAGAIGWSVMASQLQTANIFRDSVIGRCNGNSSFSSEIFSGSERCFRATSIPVIEQFACPLFESTPLSQILNFGFGERISRQRIDASCRRIFGLLGQSNLIAQPKDAKKPTFAVNITHSLDDKKSIIDSSKVSPYLVIISNLAFVVSIIILILMITKHIKERQERRKKGIYLGKYIRG